MTRIVKPEAQRDFEDALQYYADISGAVAERFRGEIRQEFDLIGTQPEAFAKIYKDYRCSTLKRFPYLILYKYVESTVYIVAIVHGRRSPLNWHNRLKSDHSSPQ